MKTTKTSGCLDRGPTARSPATTLQPHSASDKIKLRLSHSEGQNMLALLLKVTELYWLSREKTHPENGQSTHRFSSYSLRDDPSQIPPVTWGGKKITMIIYDHFLHVAMCIRPHLRCGFGETGATVLTTDHRAHGILTSNSTCDFAVGLCWAPRFWKQHCGQSQSNPSIKRDQSSLDM